MDQNYDKVNRFLYLIFFISFLAYISTLQYRPYPFSYLVKIIPILALSQIAFRNINASKSKWILAGLLFSAVGDVFLSISGKAYFLYGLGAFAIAHTMYISAFLKPAEFFRLRLFFSIPFILYGAIIAYFLLPNVGSKLIPVSIYFCLLLFMCLSTIAGRNNHYFVIAGAFLFLLSDSFIAINTYIVKMPNSSFWIMLTYYPAQFLLTYGSIKSESLSK
jgi:uncharacterized membrane protein YhhN